MPSATSKKSRSHSKAKAKARAKPAAGARARPAAKAVVKSRAARRRSAGPPLRFVLATPICDGHDAAIVAITRILREHGAEAVYIGFNKTPQQIVKAAVEEGADAIAISTYNGGHMSFLRAVLAEQARQGIPGVPMFVGGGGTILAREVAPLEKMGIARVYRPPMDLGEAIGDMMRLAASWPRKKTKASKSGAAKKTNPDVELARRLTRLANGAARAGTSARKIAAKSRLSPRAKASRNGAMAGATAPPPARVWGVGGRGGAGKSTIVDELVARFLAACTGRIAVLSVDPTLADRIRMLNCYSPRVFVRSVGLKPGQAIGRRVAPLIAELRRRPFEMVIVESVGLGQNDLGVAPFVDASVYCMTPEYGTDIQLDKEALLHRSDIVVMNKRDYPQAAAKGRRVRNYLKPGQLFFMTEARRHRDPGTAELFLAMATRAGLTIDNAALDLGSRPAESAVSFARRNYLGAIVDEHEAYYAEMAREIAGARKSPAKARAWRARLKRVWDEYGFRGLPEAGASATAGTTPRGTASPAGKSTKGSEQIENGVLWRTGAKGRRVPIARESTCGLWVPVIGLPPEDADVRQIIEYFYKQNAPGSFPFTEGAFSHRRADQNPIRMFAGLGLSETTNERFHLLAGKGGPPRLSTAFDSLTLYGLDSDEPGALAKVGEGGVAVDTVEDMERLFDGFDLEDGSVSLTMSGPAPQILAMYFAAARRRGFDLHKLRGTIQTDILKEVHAQNESLFPLDPSLRLIGDMVQWCMDDAPLWYPISISGYHIHEKGANAVQELAFTLANAFTYIEALIGRGLPIEEFTRRLTFFFTAGSELEFNALGRVARRIWSVALERHYGVKGAGRRLKFHTQTSGRSLLDVEPLHNLARVTLQAAHGLDNNTNSLHTNSYKETYTTPEAEDVALAMGCQQIPLLESGDYRFIENMNQGAYGLSYLEDELERAVHRIFREIDHQGGVLPAIENEYFRTLISEEVHKEHAARARGERVMVGVNYLTSDREAPRGELVAIPMSEKRRQVARTREFKRAHKGEAEAALARLKGAARSEDNVFAEMMNAAEVVSVGQITHALWDVWGRFRASM